MFIFEFKKTKNSLLKAIVITNKDITLYTSKSNAPEFSAIVNQSNLKKGRIADDPFHHFLHHPTIKFSAAMDSVPHQHFMFPESCDRTEGLERFLERVSNRLDSPKLRAEDCLYVFKSTESERKQFRHSELPDSIQDILHGFDTSTPFFSDEDRQECLRQFKRYTENYYFQKLDELRDFAECLMNTNWETFYKNSFYDKTTDESKSLVDFYGALTDLYSILLAIEHKPLNLQFYFFAQNIIKNLINNSNMPKTGAFFDAVRYFKNFIDTRVKACKTISQVGMGLIVFLVSLSTLLLQGAPHTRALVISILNTLIIAPIGYYFSKYSDQTFFGNNYYHRSDNGGYLELEPQHVAHSNNSQLNLDQADLNTLNLSL